MTHMSVLLLRSISLPKWAMRSVMILTVVTLVTHVIRSLKSHLAAQKFRIALKSLRNNNQQTLGESRQDIANNNATSRRTERKSREDTEHQEALRVDGNASNVAEKAPTTVEVFAEAKAAASQGAEDSINCKAVVVRVL